MLPDLGVGAGAEQHELAAVAEAVVDGVRDERHALLVVETPDEADDGLVNVLEPEAVSERALALVFVADLRGRVGLGQAPVGLGIPDVVIEAVEHAAELAAVGVEGAAEPLMLVGVEEFPRVARRDGGDEIRVNDAALEQVEHAGIARVLQAILGVEMRGAVEPGGTQDVLAGEPLVGDVVQGEADARMAQAGLLVELVEHHGHERGLPVVAVDHVGVFAGFQHELQRGFAEEGETLVVVVVPVVNAPVEEILLRVRLDEEALPSMHEAEVHGAMHGALVPRHPQILHRDLQTVDFLVAHAVVLREDDLDRITADLELATQAENHIAQPAYLGDRCAFWGNHYNVHRRGLGGTGGVGMRQGRRRSLR
ncbi:MAG: hypothetical protein BWX86_02415 [Verrucomicrobia bacterium ADurb.Bin122]|nr:MAG: hypothetical protein BWX86_02415 [Verrucomicrobia bacterium ADurb.Bin122]